KKVFGVPLEVAVGLSRVKEGYELPAVVYRCIEYLDAKKAAEEEGIYRLSGSTTTIQALKERFNNEGDVDLLGSGMYYDVHAIAGLLKMYLRELPSPILTKELREDFLRITDLNDRNDRVTELTRLVALLPLPNYTLIRSLIAHLIRVVQNSDKNRMTVKNMGIVFSPTLQVPAGVFTLMMAEYEGVFVGLPQAPGSSQANRMSVVEGKENVGEGYSVPHPPKAPHSASKRRSRATSASRTSGEYGGVVKSDEVAGEEGKKKEEEGGVEADVDEELPVPKRRQANSAKRRARQNAGMGFRGGFMEFDGGDVDAHGGGGAGHTNGDGTAPMQVDYDDEIVEPMRNSTSYMESAPESVLAYEESIKGGVEDDGSGDESPRDDDSDLDMPLREMMRRDGASGGGEGGRRHSRFAPSVSTEEVFVDGESEREDEGSGGGRKWSAEVESDYEDGGVRESRERR
ncbi:hypothetical protein HK097_011681, partial [Rhizophlyctis rosea]